MRKTAVFVEGQTELIFVRELLLKVFQYENIFLQCFNLFTEANLHETEYAVPNLDALYYFQIINVGNDQSVLARMLRREDHLKAAGFTRIIGLRDMYSKEYREMVKDHTINKELNNKFLEGHRSQIKSDDVFFSFAIMEIETWLLGLRHSFERINPALTQQFIRENLNIDLEIIDPEESFFHPTDVLADIFRLVGADYKKKKSEIYAITSNIERDDYFSLMQEGKCNSFREFYNYLQIPG